MNCYPFIEAEKSAAAQRQAGVRAAKVSRAAYYAARGGRPSDRDRQDAELTTRITAEHKRSRGRYGAPRIHAELRRQGHCHPRKRIARLMRQAVLAGRTPKRWKKTTIPDPAAAARADAIRRDFTTDAARINQRWCGDITYLATWEGWLYLLVRHRRVLAADPGLPGRLVDEDGPDLDALEQATWTRRRDGADDLAGRPITPARGSQYNSIASTEWLAAAGVSGSVGTVGDAYDNARRTASQ